MSYASENSVTSENKENSITSFEEVHKLLKAMQERWDHERRENESLKKEFERLKSENIRLEDELRKSRDGYSVAKRSRFAEDVYDILMERVRRGEGETSLKEIFNELRRRNHELEVEKRELESQLRVFGKKYKDFNQRLLELEKEMKCT